MSALNQINASTSQVSKVFIGDVPKDDPNCSICLEVIQENAVKHNDQHAFHKGCLANWLEKKNSCPMCRSVFNIRSCREVLGVNIPEHPVEFKEFFDLVEERIRNHPNFSQSIVDEDSYAVVLYKNCAAAFEIIKSLTPEEQRERVNEIAQIASSKIVTSIQRKLDSESLLKKTKYLLVTAAALITLPLCKMILEEASRPHPVYY